MTLREQLIRDEGYRAKPYRDSQGLWTVGIGWCIERRPMSRRAAEFVLDEQILESKASLISLYPWVIGLDEARQGVLVNMAFNLGLAGLGKFVKMLAAVKTGHYAIAADEMLDSKWHEQVGERAERLAEQMRDGQWR